MLRSEIPAAQEWSDLQTEIDRVIATSDEPFTRNTIGNALDLISACKNASAVPEGVAKGYWPTLRMFWPEFEIEVFEDRLEVYHFRDGGLEVWYEEHHPGTSLSTRFLSELAGVSRHGLC